MLMRSRSSGSRLRPDPAKPRHGQVTLLSVRMISSTLLTRASVANVQHLKGSFGRFAGQAVEERIEDQTDPEILLDVAGHGVTAAGRGGEHVAVFLSRQGGRGCEGVSRHAARGPFGRDVARERQRPAGEGPARSGTGRALPRRPGGAAGSRRPLGRGRHRARAIAAPGLPAKLALELAV